MESTEMQLYLSEPVNTENIREVLSDFLGLMVETIDHPIEEATAFLIITEYKYGFPIGLNVSWRQGLQPKYNHLEIAQRIAAFYNASVATDLPDNNPEFSDPFIWCVVDPDGKFFEMTENISALIQQDGLVLDQSSRKPLDVGHLTRNSTS
jgi:hypothetical protein